MHIFGSDSDRCLHRKNHKQIAWIVHNDISTSLQCDHQIKMFNAHKIDKKNYLSIEMVKNLIFQIHSMNHTILRQARTHKQFFLLLLLSSCYLDARWPGSMNTWVTIFRFFLLLLYRNPLITKTIELVSFKFIRREKLFFFLHAQIHRQRVCVWERER